jgi:hypothetical protein
VNLEAYGGVQFVDGADEVRFFQAALEHAAHRADAQGLRRLHH